MVKQLCSWVVSMPGSPTTSSKQLANIDRFWRTAYQSGVGDYTSYFSTVQEFVTSKSGLDAIRKCSNLDSSFPAYNADSGQKANARRYSARNKKICISCPIKGRCIYWGSQAWCLRLEQTTRMTSWHIRGMTLVLASVHAHSCLFCHSVVSCLMWQGCTSIYRGRSVVKKEMWGWDYYMFVFSLLPLTPQHTEAWEKCC